jgi:hypothetical protein
MPKVKNLEREFPELYTAQPVLAGSR